jgi:hypothetical protein
METKQDTLGEILDSERDMVLHGAEKYGDYFKNAVELGDLLENFTKSINRPENYIAVVFLSQVRKYHTLALFSAVRRHHNQLAMDLRQVLEAGPRMAYAMAYSDENKFCERDKNDILCIPQKLGEKKNDWLDKNFKPSSDVIKRLKKAINNSASHANLIYSFQNFNVLSDGRKRFHTPFFDFEDDFKIKGDLWLVANVAMGLLDLFYGVNQKYGTFVLSDGFLEKFKKLEQQNTKLKEEALKHERFINLQKKNLIK